MEVLPRPIDPSPYAASLTYYDWVNAETLYAVNGGAFNQSRREHAWTAIVFTSDTSPSHATGVEPELGGASFGMLLWDS
jgi:hypothetical protein